MFNPLPNATLMFSCYTNTFLPGFSALASVQYGAISYCPTLDLDISWTSNIAFSWHLDPIRMSFPIENEVCKIEGFVL